MGARPPSPVEKVGCAAVPRRSSHPLRLRRVQGAVQGNPCCARPLHSLTRMSPKPINTSETAAPEPTGVFRQTEEAAPLWGARPPAPSLPLRLRLPVKKPLGPGGAAGAHSALAPEGRGFAPPLRGRFARPGANGPRPGKTPPPPPGPSGFVGPRHKKAPSKRLDRASTLGNIRLDPPAGKRPAGWRWPGPGPFRRPRSRSAPGTPDRFAGGGILAAGEITPR